MTRAEDRLIVCGYHGMRRRSPRTWLAFVTRALAGIPKRGCSAPVAGRRSPFPLHSARPHVMAGPEAVHRRIRRLASPAGFDTVAAGSDLPKPLTPSRVPLLIDNAPSQLRGFTGARQPMAAGFRRGARPCGTQVASGPADLRARRPRGRRGALPGKCSRRSGHRDERAAGLRSVDAILADPSFAPTLLPRFARRSRHDGHT